MNPLRNFSLILATSLLLAGCYNSERINKTTQYSTTLGQEIIDLKTALDQGAIDEREYRQLIKGLSEERVGVSLSAEDSASDHR